MTTEHRVPFHSGRHARAPLTWGQRQIWRDIQNIGNTAIYNHGRCAPVPAGLTEADVLAGLAELVCRHESLRTRFRLDAQGRPEQVVSASGDLTVAVHHVAHGSDTAALADDVRREMTAEVFDHAMDLPIRAAVVTGADGPFFVIMAVSHLAADYLSLHHVMTELSELLAACLLGSPPPPTRDARQPVDQAAWEHGPSGRRALERSLRHWRRELLARPATMFPIQPVPPETPRFQRAAIVSTAAADALHVLGVRHRVSTSVILLAATAAALAELTGLRRCALLMIVGNRFAPELRNAVGSLTQEVPITIDTGVESFAELVRRTWSVTMSANRVGQYDPALTGELVGTVGTARGTTLDLLTFFNDTRPITAPDLSRAAAVSARSIRKSQCHTAVHWEGEEHDNIRLFVESVDVAVSPSSIGICAYADTCYMPRDSIAEFLFGIERLLVELVCRDPVLR